MDVRGGAQALGTDGLRPTTVIERAHAVLLTGGSTFGLDAAGGVMGYFHERGVGFPIGAVLVPAGRWGGDLRPAGGDPKARPTALACYTAC